LKRAGIKEIAINLFHRPDVIRRFLAVKKDFGLRIRFSPESRLLGTAGAVKKMERFFRAGDFLVLYGDNLMDFDICRLVAAHQRSGAAVTMGVFQPGRTEWSGVAAGLVEADPSGRVVHFLERRGNRAVSGRYWVNAGIYIVSPVVLKLISERKKCDFGKDIFPLLLRKKRRLQIVNGAHYVLASDDLKSFHQTQDVAKRYLMPKAKKGRT